MKNDVVARQKKHIHEKTIIFDRSILDVPQLPEYKREEQQG
jgi:hypothetical protein